MALSTVFFFSTLLVSFTHTMSCMTINTTSGIVEGNIESTTPNIAQYLGIPFAEPPVGARRWLAALPKSRENQTIDATRFGLVCPQFENNDGVRSNLYLTNVPEFSSPRNHQSEDCLTLNARAPWIGEGDDGLGPELGRVPYFNPSSWVERSGRLIVVGINYRLTIFGFPAAAGMPQGKQNLGLLDQRLGTEWVRDNIKNFGGDPARITLWGQSAGAISTDNYNFGYPEDPIVAGLIMDSGNSELTLASPDVEHINFTFFARHFGCNGSDPTAEVECIRDIDAIVINQYRKKYSNSGNLLTATIFPVVDNRTQLANYSVLAASGNFSGVPAIIGATTNEGIAFLPYNRTYEPDQSVADMMNLQFFHCPAVKTTQDRYAGGATTFLQLYDGNFSNITPLWWAGAYHSSELPMIFGTYDIARGEGTAFQNQVSEQMQDYWLAFAEDPVAAVLLGLGDEVARLIEQVVLEAPCNGAVPNGRPFPRFS
ncbi:alpha/beta-hydrolase [Plenodomus tracheiphilus IPT5]|uniref:Carboxylic ester hydrolase n=1 Tax=Plenodomus tracheiphilus IPT5 TaxID=1408161 RepID=A0A6A7B2W6_9PLEO|nr:alpha/beta-hydrolase [Plenodomus tracheiphilus IPT5]